MGLVFVFSFNSIYGLVGALGKEHPDMLASVSNLATILQSQGKYEEAESMNQRALEGFEKALGKNTRTR
jgi:hypothetical protein